MRSSLRTFRWLLYTKGRRRIPAKCENTENRCRYSTNPVFGFCLFCSRASLCNVVICLSNVHKWRGTNTILIPTLKYISTKAGTGHFIQGLGFDAVLLTSSGIWVPSLTSRRKYGRAAVWLSEFHFLDLFGRSPPMVNSKSMNPVFLAINYVSG